MLHNNMDLSRLIVYIQKVEDRRKKKGVCDTRRPKPYAQEGPSKEGNGKDFGIYEQPKFKKGKQSSGNSNF